MIMALVLTSAVFAQGIDLSFGGGVKGGISETKVKLSGKETSNTLTELPANLAVVGFFDATYVEAEIGYGMYSDLDTIVDHALNGLTVTGLTFAAYGKLPISLGFLTIYPFAGFEFFNVLSAERRYEETTVEELDKLNQLYLQAGVGFDIAFGKLFLRSELVLSHKLANKSEKEWMKLAKENRDLSGVSINYSNFGGAISLKLGYKL